MPEQQDAAAIATTGASTGTTGVGGDGFVIVRSTIDQPGDHV